MPTALSPSKRRRVKTMLELGIPEQEIATQTHCVKRSVQRIKHNLLYYYSTQRPKLPQQGRPPRITTEMGEVLFFEAIEIN